MNPSDSLQTQPQRVDTLTSSHRKSIGLPKINAYGERRFPLTPEGAAILVERGFDINIEEDAAEVIHFDNAAYGRAGAHIVSHAEALGSDIVLHLPAISPEDAKLMKRSATLLTLLHLDGQTAEALSQLLQRNVTAIALDLVSDTAGNTPFADILSEVDGRAAMAIASALLADPIHGKGILIGGIAGVVPCEVTILGSGLAARAAARSAVGAGALVRMFDNDIYSLRDAVHHLGNEGVIASALHPKVLSAALRSADIVVATPMRHPLKIGASDIANMKRGVIAFDLSGREDGVFPTLTRVDLSAARQCDNLTAQVRRCYINAGSAVPRTAAMALSTTLMTLFDEFTNGTIADTLRYNKGIARAVYLYSGKAMQPDIAKIGGVRAMDINLFLQFS